MEKLKKLIWYFISKVNSDHLGAYSSQAAYFIILSAVPFAIFILSIIQYTPLSYDDVVTVIRTIVPGISPDYIDGMLQQIYQSSTIALTSVTIFFVLWSAGRAIFSITNGINEIYQIKETRNYFHLRFNAMIYTMLLAIGLIFIMILVLFGRSVYTNVAANIHLNKFFLYVISIRLLVIFILLFCGLIFIYMTLPNTHTTFVQAAPGAIAVTIGLIITTYFFEFFFNFTNSFSYMYGSLAGIMVLMFWLYTCMFQVFLGAEFNQLLYHGNRDGESVSVILDDLEKEYYAGKTGPIIDRSKLSRRRKRKFGRHKQENADAMPSDPPSSPPEDNETSDGEPNHPDT